MRLIWVLGFSLTLAEFASAQGNWGEKLFGGNLSHDFGTVPRGTQLKYSFPIKNIYKEPLTITDVKVTCGCLTATPSTKLIQPGESASLNVHMDAKQFSGPKKISIHVSVGQAPKYYTQATLVVTANARQDVVFNPGEIDFGLFPRGQSPKRSIEVEYAGSFDWEVREIVKSKDAPFELSVEPLVRAGSAGAYRGYRIHATVKADAATGPFKQDILLKTNDPVTPNLHFFISGSIVASLVASPNPVTFEGKAGETMTKKILVKGSRPFRILRIDGIGDGVSVETPATSETTHILSASIASPQAGEFRRTLTVRTDAGNEAVNIQLVGFISP